MADAQQVDELASGSPEELDLAAIREAALSQRSQVVGLALTYRDVATLFQVSPQTVMQWVKQGRLCSPVYHGMTARFDRTQVHKALTFGLSPPGTFVKPITARSRAGKMGAAAKADKRIALESAAKKKTRKPPTKKGK